MPISECDGRPEAHWLDVLVILKDAAEEAGFETRLVSDTFESNLIHKEILQNIYQDDLIICDVSGRNPNVFFELGIRMATQKPTVIVKDDKTSYPFDTGPNRYVGYPRDLRHPQMEVFKSELKKSISKTIDQAPEASFIGHLGPFQVPDVESATLPASDIILERLDRMERHLFSSQKEIANRFRKMPNAMSGFQLTLSTSGEETASLTANGVSNVQVDNGIRDFEKQKISENLDIRVRHTGPYSSNIKLEGYKAGSEEILVYLQAAIDSAIPF